MREETRVILDEIDRDLEREFDRELTRRLDSEEIFEDLEGAAEDILQEPIPAVKHTPVAEAFKLGMPSMDTAKKKLIAAAEKGKTFVKWLATKPEELTRVYPGGVPSAQEIIAKAKETQLKALMALDHWEHSKWRRK